MTTLPTIQIKGPFWTAIAEVIRLAGPRQIPADDQWALRNLFVERVGQLQQYNPDTLIALCWIRKVEIQPTSDKTYTWQRPNPEKAPQKPNLEQIKAGLDRGELSLLLLGTDPNAPEWQSGQVPQCTCLAGEIHLLSWQEQNKLLQAIGLEPAELGQRSEASYLLSPISVHASGMTLFGQVRLPWQADSASKLSAPFQLSQVDKAQFYLKPEIERFTDNERKQWLQAWQQLDEWLRSKDIPSPTWVTLQITNLGEVPSLYWQIESWSDAPRKIFPIQFEKNSFRLLLTDRSPYDPDVPPNSLAQVSPSVRIEATSEGLLIQASACKSPSSLSSENQGELSYSFKSDQESITLTGLAIAFDPVQIPQFLREHQGIPTPEWYPSKASESSQTTNELPVLWGFMPLTDGWAQLPIPNLTEQIYLNANLAHLPTLESTRPISLLQGAVFFGKDREDQENPHEHPWTVTVMDAVELYSEWKFTKQPRNSQDETQQQDSKYQLSIDLKLKVPNISVDGLFWLSTGKPRAEDALPDLTDWISGLQSIPLQTVRDNEDIFPPLIVLKLEKLQFKARSEKRSAELCTWKLNYEANRALFTQKLNSSSFNVEQLFSKASFSKALIWRRHPSLPMIQALPMTQSQSPPNYPCASRQLVPYELPTDAEKLPQNWQFGAGAAGASQWASFSESQDLLPAAEWREHLDLPLVSLSIPGVILDPNLGSQPGANAIVPHAGLYLKEMQLYQQYRFDLPYTDELNALAQVPKVPTENNLSSKAEPEKSVKPLSRETLGEHWQQLSERASLASGDAVLAFRTSDGETFVQGLIEPLLWKVNPFFELKEYPGNLTIQDPNGAAEPLTLGKNNDDAALEGITGRFVKSDGSINRVTNSNTNTIEIKAGSMSAYVEKDRIFDQRGLSRALSQVSQHQDNLLVTQVALESKLCDLTTTLKPVPLKLNDQQNWKLWFRDLPFQKDTFNRDETRSDLAQDINDPEAQSRELNYLNGYEWRLCNESNNTNNILPLPCFGLVFYPLVLARSTKKDGKIQTVEIVGRLQLPIKNYTEAERINNVVCLTFEHSDPTSQFLQLTKVALEPPLGQQEIPELCGEWLLEAEHNSRDSAVPCRLEWKSVRLDSSRLIFEKLTLQVHLFGVNWSLPNNQGSLEFPLADSIEILFTGSTTSDDEITLKQATLSVNRESSSFNPQIRLEFNVQFGDRTASVPVTNSRVAGGLQVLYTFTEGSGNVIHDRSGSPSPVNLVIQNQSNIRWLPNGGLAIVAPTIAKSETPVQSLVDRFRGKSEITLEVWIKPASNGAAALDQHGARILTLSKSLEERNFTLAQGVFQRTLGIQTGNAHEYNVRLRQSSPIQENSLDGLPALQTGSGFTVSNQLTHLVFTRKRGESKLYINGEEITPRQPIQLDGDLSNWDTGCFLALGNELTQNRPWLGEYYLVAIYDRALIQAEVRQNYQAGYEQTRTQTQVISAFQATLQYTLPSSTAGTWSNGKLLGDLMLDTQKSTTIITNDAFQFQWTSSQVQSTCYLLPGMQIQPERVSGYAAIAFTVKSSTSGLPRFEIKTAAIEALLYAQWGQSLQENEAETTDQGLQRVFGASAGNLVVGYTGENLNNQWQETLLLNGMIEIKSLISWATDIVKNDDKTLPATTLTLPAARLTDSKEQPPLNHIRHTLRILFNQHQIVPDQLVASGNRNILFNLAPDRPWEFRAVVEHQLITVKPSLDLGSIALEHDRRWTVVQPVRFFLPKHFRQFLDSLNNVGIQNPAGNTKPTEINYGYLRADLRLQLSNNLDLQDDIIFIEASSAHWIRTTNPIRNDHLIPIQFLPSGTQQAILASPQDYVGSNPTQPEWLLLVMPFLGRLQASNFDQLPLPANNNQIPKAYHPLQVDPILHLHYLQQNLSMPQSTLALALAHRADTSPLSIDLSGFDTCLGHQWARLDPLALQESWFRIQNPPLEPIPSSLTSVIASLPDTAARLSRESALAHLFPQHDELTARTSQFLLVLQGILAEDRHDAPYAWLLTGVLIQQAFSNPIGKYYAAATILPNHGEKPSNLVISPYAGLQFQAIVTSDQKASPDLLLLAELLCFKAIALDQKIKFGLRPVASYTWEIQKKSEVQKWVEAWARQIHDLEFSNSPFAIVRCREIYSTNSSIPIKINYTFSLIETNPTILPVKRVFALRSPIPQLRFREAQFNPINIPENLNPVEIAPPHTIEVQPFYLPENPNSGEIDPSHTTEAQPSYSPIFSVSGLRCNVHYTDQQAGIVESELSKTSKTTLWQAFQHTVQFRSAKTAGSEKAVAGLPKLFRASAIKCFLPVIPNPPLPSLNQADLDQKNDNAWQPVLPGSIQYLLLGNRPGVMFAIRNQLLRQQTTYVGQEVLEAILTSGSVPIQHRMPRPVPLPKNTSKKPEKALQTWASYFEPEQPLLAANSPVDEAFYAEYEEQPARRFKMQLKTPKYGVILNDWNGALEFEVSAEPASTQHTNPSNAAPSAETRRPAWKVIVYLMIGNQKIDYELDQRPYCYKPKKKEEVTQILAQKQGQLFTVLALVQPPEPSGNEKHNSFQQILSFPLRRAGDNPTPCALEPYFIYFEDPEYNRRLASLAAHSSQTIRINQELRTLTLATDRRKYNPDSLLYFRFDWDNQDSLKLSGVELTFTKNSQDPSGWQTLTSKDTAKTPLEPGKLHSISLADLEIQSKDRTEYLTPGSKLEITLGFSDPASPDKKDPASPDKKDPVPPDKKDPAPPDKKIELSIVVDIVEAPVNPVPQAAYALLRGSRHSEGQVPTQVECVRFAWSPEPSRIELVCAEDLRTEVVRRRAVFQWQDSARTQIDQQHKTVFAIQKITQTGSTHFPQFRSN